MGINWESDVKMYLETVKTSIVSPATNFTPRCSFPGTNLSSANFTTFFISKTVTCMPRYCLLSSNAITPVPPEQKLSLLHFHPHEFYSDICAFLKSVITIIFSTKYSPPRSMQVLYSFRSWCVTSVFA